MEFVLKDIILEVLQTVKIVILHVKHVVIILHVTHVGLDGSLVEQVEIQYVSVETIHISQMVTVLPVIIVV